MTVDLPQDRSTRQSTVASSLLVGLRCRDAEAWRRFVALYGPIVYRSCRRSQLRPDEAMDVLQEVFRSVVIAIEHFRRDRPGDTFHGWLRAITRNKVCDFFRAAGRQPLPLGTADPPDATASGGDAEDAAELADETTLILRRAMELVRAEFEERTWQACWRTVVDGKRAADVAADLNMTVGAVYQAKSRVLARLRSELEGLIDC